MLRNICRACRPIKWHILKQTVLLIYNTELLRIKRLVQMYIMYNGNKREQFSQNKIGDMLVSGPDDLKSNFWEANLVQCLINLYEFV